MLTMNQVYNIMEQQEAELCKLRTMIEYIEPTKWDEYFFLISQVRRKLSQSYRIKEAYLRRLRRGAKRTH